MERACKNKLKFSCVLVWMLPLVEKTLSSNILADLFQTVYFSSDFVLITQYQQVKDEMETSRNSLNPLVYTIVYAVCIADFLARNE